jgi:hypothetical protein
MATFRVGQRVRIVGPFRGINAVYVAHLLGREATIVRRASRHGETTFGERGWEVNLKSVDGYCAQFPESILEPIVDDRNAKVLWESCEWQPPVEVVA